MDEFDSTSPCRADARLEESDADDHTDFPQGTSSGIQLISALYRLFIGTSNMTDLLTDPTGSRRFLCAEVDDKIDCTPPGSCAAVRPVESGAGRGERYWFSEEEEKGDTAQQPEFLDKMPAEQELFLRCFRMPQERELFGSWIPRRICSIIAETLSAAMRGVTEPVGQDDGCIRGHSVPYRVWQCTGW